VLALVTGLSVMRSHKSIERLHLGLQRLLKVGLNLPVLQKNHTYKHKQCAPFGRRTGLEARTAENEDTRCQP
jgi:hypothetical protein